MFALLVFGLFATLCVPHISAVELEKREPPLYSFYISCPAENISPTAADECAPLAGQVSLLSPLLTEVSLQRSLRPIPVRTNLHRHLSRIPKQSLLPRRSILLRSSPHLIQRNKLQSQQQSHCCPIFPR